jgi:ketosteroid isomerase-like protein
MSEGNLEIVRQAVDLFRNFDLRSEGGPIGEGDVAAGLELFHPDLELDASRAPMPDLRGTFRGVTEVVTFWSKWLEAWDSVEFKDDLTDASDKVLAAITPMAMRGKGSGVAVEFPRHWHVFTLREGKVVHDAIFFDKAEALEAAGLRGAV